MTIKQQYNKILEGCKKKLEHSENLHHYCDKHFILNCECSYCSKEHLCPSCQAKKEVFLERCKDELKWIEDDLMLDLKVLRHKLNEKTIAQIGTEERISQLKEVLEIK